MKIQRRQYQEGEIRRRDRQAKMEAIATSEAYTLSMETQTRGWASDEFYTKVQSDSRYYTKAQSDAAYQPVGSYATISQLGNYYTKTEIDTNIYTKSQSNSTFKAIGYVPTWSEITGKPTFGNSATRDVGTTSGTVMAGDGAYTKSDSDNRYYQKSQTYTQSEVNNLINGYITQAQGDARYNRLASDNTWTARNFMPNGSNGSPSMAYSGSTNTGFYAPANGGLAISVGGSQIAHWRMNGSTMQMGFFGVTPVPRQSITGLLSILNLSIFNTMVQAGVNLGLWTDNRIL